MMELESLENNDIFCFFTKEKNDANFLLGKEKSIIHTYAPKRTEDFSTGRYCARRALKKLRIPPQEILFGPNKEPLWPKGIVGSISHCDSLTCAIVAKKSDHISLGLDIEEIGRVTPDFFDLVFTENEKRYLSSFTRRKLEEQSTVIFSIKEAFYKFQHPLTNTFLDFLDVEVSLPYFENVVVLSNEISIESMIRKNRIKYFFDNDCVISIVTKN